MNLLPCPKCKRWVSAQKVKSTYPAVAGGRQVLVSYRLEPHLVAPMTSLQRCDGTTPAKTIQ